MLVCPLITEISPERHQDMISLFESNRYLELIWRAILRQELGVVHADDAEDPRVAMLAYKFLIFFAGDARHHAVDSLLAQVPQRHLMFIPDDAWAMKFTEIWGQKLKSKERTKFSSKNLSIEHMDCILEHVPEGMAIGPLTRDSIHHISDQAKGIISLLFPRLDDFMNANFGYCVMESERIVSLSLAATPIEDGSFEIHIETEPSYQKRGLAMLSAAQLIKHSLELNLVPHWDADNQQSAKLATKLGFSEPNVYRTYFWTE